MSAVSPLEMTNVIPSYKIITIIFIEFIVLFSSSYLSIQVLQWLPNMTKKRSFLSGDTTTESWFFSDITITTVFLLTSRSVCLRFLTLLAGVDPAGKVQNFCWLNNKASSLFHLEIRGNKEKSLFISEKQIEKSLFIYYYWQREW